MQVEFLDRRRRTVRTELADATFGYAEILREGEPAHTIGHLNLNLVDIEPKVTKSAESRDGFTVRPDPVRLLTDVCRLLSIL